VKVYSVKFNLSNYRQNEQNDLIPVPQPRKPKILRDRKLTIEQNTFKKIALSNCTSLKSTVIKTIENIEIKNGAAIETLVDSVDENGMERV
jgi:hypothetical protein